MDEGKEMRLVIADLRAKIRSALRLLLEQGMSFSVVGDVAKAEDLLVVLQANKPDVLLLDWSMIKASASETLADLREHLPGLKVVVLSGGTGMREDILALGVENYVRKTDPPERLISVLEGLREDAAK